MRILFWFLFITSFTSAYGQIPVEIMSGYERSTVDILFFSFFKNKEGEKSPWLFFNRNRASIDYRMTDNTYLPQFGFTEAVSYNHQKLKGFAPVAVGQVLSWGAFAKAGIQYAHINKNIMLFTWVVCEVSQNPGIDQFLLFRYTPKITEKTKLFSQLESAITFPTAKAEDYSFTQRFRLGLQLSSYQFGAAADFNQTGRSTFTSINNIGAFIRHEF